MPAPPRYTAEVATEDLRRGDSHVTAARRCPESLVPTFALAGDMAILLTMVALALALLVMPDVFMEILNGAMEYPGYGIAFLAVLVLVGVWIDRR